MKKLLLVLVFLFNGVLFAQNCSFVATSGPSGAVTFVPTFTFPSGIYSWDFGDNSTGLSMGTIVHTYNAMGPFSVCMNVIDSMTGTTCSYCDTVVVNSPGISCNFQVFANPGSLIVDFLCSPPAGAYASWDFGDGSVGTGNNPFHTYPTIGSYTVTLNIIDSATSNSLCTSTQVATVASTTNNCYFLAYQDSMNQNMFYFYGSPAYPGSTLVWDFGDSSATGLGSSVNHVYSQPGVYQVCMTEMDSSMAPLCQSCQMITIAGSANCAFNYYIDPVVNGLVTLTSLYNGPQASIYWSIDNGMPIIGSVATVQLAPGAHTVCMTAVDAMGVLLCNSCQSIVISTPSTSCAAYFIASSLGLTTSFIDLSSGTSSATQFNWSFGDGGNSNTRFPQHTYSMPGIYQACLTITDSTCSDTYCYSVLADSNNVNPGPCQAQFVVLQVAPFDVVVIDLSTGSNLSYSWDFGDGNTSMQQYPSHYYNTTGSYVLCLTVSNGLLGCSSTFCDTLNVDSLGNVYRSLQGFSINVVSASDFTAVGATPTSVGVELYPNPVKDQFVIRQSNNSLGNATYRILSMQGSVYAQGVISGISNSINASFLPAGTYLLELHRLDGSVFYHRLVKN